MTERYTEAEAIAAVARLTRSRLIGFIQAQVVSPLQSDDGQVFRRIDLVRLELLCDLSDAFDLDDDALGVVMSLVDQLHTTRAELRRVIAAVQAEPGDVRARIAAQIRGQGDDAQTTMTRGTFGAARTDEDRQ